MKNIKNKIDKKLTIKSSTANLSTVRNFIKSSALECGFDEETTGKIILAVDEACTNIIKHAYNYSPDGEILVNVKFYNKKFSIIITDNGSSFDSSLIPEPNLEEYLKQKKVGGLGMFLMRKLMDQIKYSHPAKGKNRVTLVKYLS
ncbi:serine-protein kinase RsbW [bacterium BMS3Abin04]|nr:serine-protein kinase RsbW [bacterium BMS3Abin04]